MSVLKAYERRRARKMQQKAYDTDQRRAQLQAMRSSVQQIRQAQIQRAEIMQMGENQGVSGSSGVLGGMASAQSQATSNIAFGQQIFSLQQSAGRMRQASQKHMANVQTIEAIEKAFMGGMGG